MARDRTRGTVREIADQTGYSIATVSRVLNGQSNVAPTTRARVLSAIERGPEPATIGATRGPGRAGNGRAGNGRAVDRRAVLVRCPYVLTDYFGLIVSAVAETLEMHAIPLLLNAGESSQHSSILADLPNRTGVRGALLVLPPETSEELVALRTSGLPFVIIDPRIPPPPDMAAVSASHFTGAHAVTGLLLGLGHVRIGLVAGPRNWLASDARRTGHAAALAEAGLLPQADLLRHADATVADGCRAAGELLDLPDRPTALVGFSDKTAVGALQAAAERGLRVPQDLSVTGFDDIDLACATQPRITTVRQPLQEMGRMAVGLLQRLMSQQDLDALHIELATTLVVRESTGPAPR